MFQSDWGGGGQGATGMLGQTRDKGRLIESIGEVSSLGTRWIEGGDGLEVERVCLWGEWFGGQTVYSY